MLNPSLVKCLDNNVPGFIRKCLQAILHRLMNTSGRMLFVKVRFEALVNSKMSRNVKSYVLLVSGPGVTTNKC